MPSANVDIVLKARDEATAQMQALARSMGGVTDIAKRMTSALGFTGSGITTIGLQAGIVGSAALAAGGALVQFANRISNEVEQLDNLSASTGISAHNLQVLQFAFKQGGVDAEALTKGIAFMQRAIENNDPVLAKLGVTSRDTFEAFLEASRGIHTAGDAATRTTLVYQMFGKGGAQLLPIMDQLATGFDGISAAATRSGNVLNDPALAKMRELDAQMDRVSASVDGFGKSLAVAVGGPLVKFAEQINGIYEAWHKLSTLSGFMRTFSETFLGAKTVVGGTGGGAPEINGVSVIAPQEKDMLGPGNRAGFTDFLRRQFEEQHAAIEKLVAERRRLADELARNPFGELGPTGASSFGPFGPDPRKSHGGGDVRFESFATALKIGPMVDEAKAHLKSFSEILETFAAKWKESFEIIGQSVYFGIASVFDRITSRGQTFRTAMTTIFQSLVQGIVATIGHLVASEAVKQLLKLLGIALSALTGNPFIGAAAAAAGDFNSPLTAAGGSAASTSGFASFGRTPSGGNTFIIQTISAKDVLQSLVSPTGAMRSANDRLIEVAAAS